MKAYQVVAPGRLLKQAFLDHLGTQANQRQRVILIGPVISRDVENAGQLSAPVKDRRRRTGQELVAFHVMLGRVHQHCFALHGCRADGVGALRFLVPANAGLKGNPRSPAEKVIVTDRVQDQPLGVTQHHHAARVGDLAGQVVHDRCRPAHQPFETHGTLLQFGGCQPAGVARTRQRNAALGAAGPGTLDFAGHRLMQARAAVARTLLQRPQGSPLGDHVSTVHLRPPRRMTRSASAHSGSAGAT